jgi:F0F1-type ATP synthase membrane subunit b/b'
VKKVIVFLFALALIASPRFIFAEDKGLHLGGLEKDAKKAKIEAKKAAQKAEKEAERARKQAQKEAEKRKKDMEKAKKTAEKEAEMRSKQVDRELEKSHR